MTDDVSKTVECEPGAADDDADAIAMTVCNLTPMRDLFAKCEDPAETMVWIHGTIQEAVAGLFARRGAQPPAGGAEPQPVAWLVKDFADGWYTVRSEKAAKAAESDAHSIVPLYAAPPPAQAPDDGDPRTQDLTWFWQIVDADGFADLPSVETDALRLLCKRASAQAPDDGWREMALDALRNVQRLIAEGATEGFSQEALADWADRLFASQQKTSAAIRAMSPPPPSQTAEGEAPIVNRSRLEPGHGHQASEAERLEAVRVFEEQASLIRKIKAAEEPAPVAMGESEAEVREFALAYNELTNEPVVFMDVRHALEAAARDRATSVADAVAAELQPGQELWIMGRDATGHSYGVRKILSAAPAKEG